MKKLIKILKGKIIKRKKLFIFERPNNYTDRVSSKNKGYQVINMIAQNNQLQLF